MVLWPRGLTLHIHCSEPIMLSAEWTIFIAQFASLSARQHQASIALLRGNAP